MLNQDFFSATSANSGIVKREGKAGEQNSLVVDVLEKWDNG